MYKVDLLDVNGKPFLTIEFVKASKAVAFADWAQKTYPMREAVMSLVA
jgi:hypothetical protein